MPHKLTKRAAARLRESPVAIAPAPPPDLANDPPPAFFAHLAVRRWLPALALALLAFLFLYPVLHATYIWDDDEWLTTNGLVTQPGHLHTIWFQPRASPQYYPLVFTSYWIECRLFHGLGHLDPDGIFRGPGYHLDNLLLHIASALLIFHILKKLRLPGGTLGAFLAAALFALHPTAVESVVWIAERKNCLSGLLFFAALYFAFRFFRVFERNGDAASFHPPGTRHPALRTWAPYAAALTLFILAMLSKTTTCVLGPVILLLIWWRRGCICLRECLLALPFFLIGAALGAFTAHMEVAHVGSTGPEFDYSLLQRFLIAGTDLWFYLEKLLLPYPVMPIYPRFDIVAGQTVTNPLYYAAPLAFLALIALLFFLRKKISRGPVTALLFFAGVVAPALGFLNFYTMLFTFVADHYQYLASIGIIVLVVETLLFALKKAAARIPAAADPQAPARFLRLTSALLAAALILATGTLANAVSQLYADGQVLWTFNKEHNPNASPVYQCLAASCLDRIPPQTDQAIAVLKESIQCNPANWRPWHALGILYLETKKQPEEGMKYLIQAEALMPEFVRQGRANIYARHAAQAVDPFQQIGREKASFGPHFLLAKHYQDTGEFDKAIAQYQIDLKEIPGDLQAYVNCGLCYIGQDDCRAALECFQKALDAYPKYAEAWFGRGLALRGLHQEDQAQQAFHQSMLLDPNGTFLLQYPNLLRAKAAQYRQKPAGP